MRANRRLSLARAQTLIWHPDKNPGDSQAQRVYDRMLNAYNLLMDPAQRQAHDAALLARANGGGGTPSYSASATNADGTADGRPQRTAHDSPGALEVEKRQLPPEDLGAPPPSARPFAYVDKEPGSATPAAKAGLRRGDALLRIGDAAHLRDVQSQLQGSLHQPLPMLVIDLKGRFLKKWVVPHAWDSWAPASLLGCQMSDQCPDDLKTKHPVELAERQRQRGKRNEDEESEEEDEEEAGGRQPKSATSTGTSATSRGLPRGSSARSSCMARVLLFVASLGGLGLGASIIVAPAVSYEIFDVWKLASLHCDDIIEFITVAAVPPIAPPPPLPPAPGGGYSPPPPASRPHPGSFRPESAAHSGLRRHARSMRQLDSAAPATGGATTVEGHAALPPQLNLAPPPRAPRPSPPPALPVRSAAPFAPPARPPPQSLPPLEHAPGDVPSVVTPPHASHTGDVLGPVQHSLEPSGSTNQGSQPMGTFVRTIVATKVGIDVIRNPVMYLLSASAVIILISLIGLALACVPASRMRGLLTAVYLCCGLPSWVFLVFVSVSALALREDATALVDQYWQCLKKASPTGASGVPDAYRHLEAAAGICITSAALLLLALLAACSAIGWRRLSRHSIVCISIISGLVGAATLAVGVVLKATSNIDHQFFDGAVMGVGGCVFVVSLIGVIGSKQESKCLLRFYAFALAALIVAIGGVASYLLVSGDVAVGSWLDANWSGISQHICTSAMNLCGGALITREEIHQRASAHLLEITTLLVLLLLVLIVRQRSPGPRHAARPAALADEPCPSVQVDLLMACVLQHLVAKHGRKSDNYEIEIKRLVVDDDEEEE